MGSSQKATINTVIDWSPKSVDASLAFNQIGTA
jgi:hypothetical protein